MPVGTSGRSGTVSGVTPVDDARPVRYMLQSDDGRMVTNDTRSGPTLTKNLQLAYVWIDAIDAERQRRSYEIAVGMSLTVQLQGACRRYGNCGGGG